MSKKSDRKSANTQTSADTTPSFPNAWTREPYYGQIKQWAREGAEHGRFVFVRIGPRMIAVLPDREVDLGRVDPQDNITVARRPGPAGVTYEVEVKKGA